MIKARGCCCEACGAYATDYLRAEAIPAGAATVRSLDVHHLDENEDNNDPDNLIALCHGCHQRTHDKEPHVSDRDHHRGGPTHDSVKAPSLDWEGLSLDEQAARVREHLQGRVLVTPPPSRRPGRRKGRQRYTRADRAAWRAERVAEGEAQRAGRPQGSRRAQRRGEARRRRGCRERPQAANHAR